MTSSTLSQAYSLMPSDIECLDISTCLYSPSESAFIQVYPGFAPVPGYLSQVGLEVGDVLRLLAFPLDFFCWTSGQYGPCYPPWPDTSSVSSIILVFKIISVIIFLCHKGEHVSQTTGLPNIP